MMTRERELLQQALDALDRAISDDRAYIRECKDAAEAIRAHLAAQPAPAEPVALESVHLTRDIKGMCTVRVNGRVALQDNGDIIDHMATLEWFAQPAPAEHVAWCKYEQRHERPTRIVLCDSDEDGAFRVYAAPPAAQPALVLLTDVQILNLWDRVSGITQAGERRVAFARAIERAHGIAASPAAPAAPVVPLTDERITKALRRAFSLGQTYWQQADSDSYKQNAKSDETRQKFETLIVETLNGITGGSK